LADHGHPDFPGPGEIVWGGDVTFFPADPGYQVSVVAAYDFDAIHIDFI
jgi:hypothetical protein